MIRWVGAHHEHFIAITQSVLVGVGFGWIGFKIHLIFVIQSVLIRIGRQGIGMVRADLIAVT